MFLILLLSLSTLKAIAIPETTGSFLSRHSAESFVGTPLDRAHSLKLRTGVGISEFSFANPENYATTVYSFLKVRTLLISSNRSARVLTAVGLSVALIFLIFFIALQLQKAVIMRAFEEAEKDAPRIQTTAILGN